MVLLLALMEAFCVNLCERRGFLLRLPEHAARCMLLRAHAAATFVSMERRGFMERLPKLRWATMVLLLA